MVIYFASPIASTNSLNKWNISDSKFSRNNLICSALRKEGFEIYLPQENQKETGKETWEEQRKIIRDCEFLIIVLSDTRGIYLEAGYAKALGKKVYGIEVKETRKYSEWMSSFFDYIAKDVNQLIDFLKNSK